MNDGVPRPPPVGTHASHTVTLHLALGALAGVKGHWVQIVPRPAEAVVAVQALPIVPGVRADVVLDVGVGLTGEEVVILGDIPLSFLRLPVPLPRPVEARERVVVRGVGFRVPPAGIAIELTLVAAAG